MSSLPTGPNVTVTGVERESFADFQRSRAARRRTVVVGDGRRNTVLTDLTDKEQRVKRGLDAAAPDPSSDALADGQLIRQNNLDPNVAWQRMYVTVVNNSAATILSHLRSEYAGFVVEEIENTRRDPNLSFLTEKVSNKSRKFASPEMAVTILSGGDWRSHFKRSELVGEKLAKTRQIFFFNFHFVCYCERHFSEENIQAFGRLMSMANLYRDVREGILEVSALRAPVSQFVNDIEIYNLAGPDQEKWRHLLITMTSTTPSGLTLTEASRVIGKKAKKNKKSGTGQKKKTTAPRR